MYYPVGIKNEPNAQDEYDGYIGRLYEWLVVNATDAKLSKYLYWVAHDRMGFEEAKARYAVKVAALKSIPISICPDLEIRYEQIFHACMQA